MELFLPMTKNGKPFRLPIVPEHLAVLASMRGLHPRWVFPGRCNGDHLLEPERIPGYTVHSLRHTFGTTAGEIGVSEDSIGRLLNHTSGKVTARYVRPSLDALRPAMAATVAELQRRMRGDAVALAA